MNRATGVPTRSASVSTAFRFADLAIRSADIGSESEAFLRTIRIVHNDLFEVERLVAVGSVRTKLAYTPGRLPWIRSAIENTTSALEEIGKWVDCGDVGQHSNVLDQSQKLRYILNDRERLADRKSELMACHQQLSNVLSFLNRLEDLPTSKELPTYQNTTYFDDIVSRHKRVISQHQLEGVSIKTVKGNNVQTTWCDAADGTGSTNKISLLPEALYTQDIWTTDPVKSASQLLGGYKETKSSYSTLDYNTFDQGYLSPHSLPNSPPPTYASAGQQSPQSQTSQGDTKHHLDTDPSRRGSSRLSMRKAHDDLSTTPLVQEGTWAYIHPGGHQAIAELAGDYSMSGTNSAGPVNPHAFHPMTPAPTLKSNIFKNEQSETLSELLGDISLAVELPGSEPTHSSSHSARLSRDISLLPSQRAHTSQNSNRYQTLLSELPATPTRRPIFSHTVSEPIAISNEPSVPLLTSELGFEPPRIHMSLNAQRQTTTNRPWSVSAISSDPRPPTRSMVSLHSSPRVAPTTAQPGIERDRPMSSQATQATQAVHASNNTTSARMRRQKHMLDLLGSIDR